MEYRKPQRFYTASSVAQDKVARVQDLGRGSCSKSRSQSPMASSGASGAAPCMATTRSSGSDLQTQPASGASLAAQANHPETTKAGKPRQRMKWTVDMNIFIMRTYYMITKLETDLTLYRPQLHAAFILQFPQLTVTEQRIADQRRAIITRNLLAPALHESIKQEVAAALNEVQAENTVGDSLSESQTTTTRNTECEHCTEQPPLSNDPDTQLVQQVTQQFHSALTEYTGTDPTCRPFIPKQAPSRNLSQVTHVLNTHVLPEHIVQSSTLTDMHTIVYCAAVAAVRCNGGNIKPKTERENTPLQKPAWESRLQNKIDDLRRDIGRLTQFARGNASKKVRQHVKKILKRTKTHSKHENNNQHIEEHLDTLKQKLSALNKRLRRYRKCTLRKKQNNLFAYSEKLFYKTLNKTSTVNNGTPSQADLQHFWGSLWSDAIQHKTDASWINTEEANTQHIPEMPFTEITLEDIATAINKTHNWKAPGIDNIHNFWYKKFTCTHKHLAELLTQYINHPDTIPSFLTHGISYLKPKDSDTRNPSKYRPITCLPTLYKILTSCITNKIYAHCEQYNILTEQQKGCRRNTQGCKEQVLIDSVVLEQAYKKHRNVYTTYIDYKKAFDSVPHSWLIKVLQLYKINSALITFLQHIMQTWETTLKLQLDNRYITTPPIPIRRGIFQGDSLSPLWFCLALNPLSNMLNDSNYGFAIKQNKDTLYKLSHLLYMDDIKLYASTKAQLHQLTQITEAFSQDIHMQFGMDKCKTQHVTHGVPDRTSTDLMSGATIESLDEGEVYKYLGFAQSRRIEHKQIKETLRKTYLSRANNILKTTLNAKHTIKAINTYAVPVLTYSFGIVQWSQTELDDLNRKTRTTLTKHRQHHPQSCIERLTLPRGEGGRGLIDIKTLHNKQIESLRGYFHKKQHTSLLHKAVVMADLKHTPLHLSSADDTSHAIMNPTDKVIQWAQKALHGRHCHDLSQPHVDKAASNSWLAHGTLFPETEGFMISIQDQVVKTRNYKKHILADTSTTDDTCRRCHRTSETIQHITSGCTLLSNTDYKHRHDQVAKIIHQKLANKHKLANDSDRYYKYTPATLLENDTHKLYWDRAIITDKTIHHNRPDITLVDKGNKTTYLIDIAVPNTHNLQTVHTEKIAKYTDLALEIQEQWHMNKVFTIPIVMSATGVVPKTLHKGLTDLNLDVRMLTELQKAIIINTCHIVRRFLNTDLSQPTH